MWIHQAIEFGSDRSVRESCHIPRKTLIGRDLGPYNRASATGECGKRVFAGEARCAGPAVRPACLLAVSEVRTVERSVR